MQTNKHFPTQPNDSLNQLNCKLVASIQSSDQNYSIESKVVQHFRFGPSQPYQEQKSQYKNNHKNIQKLDEQLDEIQRLKHNYQTRNDRARNFNTQNSDKSRSIEKKHNLKPSQIPSFIRRFETHQVQQDFRKSQQKCLSPLQQSSAQSTNNQSISNYNYEAKQIQILELKRQCEKLQDEVNSKNNIINELKQTINQLRQYKYSQDQDIDGIKQQNKHLKVDLQKIKVEKEQLETILKDILFERERQKLFGQTKEQKETTFRQTPISHNSNATSSRKSFTPSRTGMTRPSPRGQNINNNFYTDKTNSQSGSKITYRDRERVKETRLPLQQILVNQQTINDSKPHKQQKQSRKGAEESKKMKVQNILDKLKIKINKN